MENSCIINSFSEFKKIKNELKDIKIWVCSSACGETYLCDLDDRFYDLDIFRHNLRHSGQAESADETTILKMQSLLKEGKIVLNASHDFFIDYLEEKEIPYVFMYGKPEVESEYADRMRHRGSGEEFVKTYSPLVSALYKSRTTSKFGSFRLR